MQQRNRGFTLIEVIVVLSVLAVLAGMLVPAMTGWIDDAHAKKCISEMGFVRRNYQSLAVFDEYDIADPLPLLAEVVAEVGGTAIDATHYTASCGGTCTVTYEKNNAGIRNITCSLHGPLTGKPDGLIYRPGDAPNGVFKNMITSVQASATPLTFSTTIDSTVTNGANYQKAMAYFDANNIDLEDYGIKSWCISVKESSLAKPVLIWSDQDVATAPVGSYVRVIRYNTTKGTYTAGYMQVVEKTEAPYGTHNTLAASVKPGEWEEYVSASAGAQTTASKLSYEDTLAYYNEMEPAK